MPNQSQAEQFDRLYGRLWRVLLKADSEDLSQHERQLLHHVPAEKGIPLGVLARHLGMPKSSASEQVKNLQRRGFLTRHRDPEDERQLSIVLTDAGAARVTLKSRPQLDGPRAYISSLAAGGGGEQLTRSCPPS